MPDVELPFLSVFNAFSGHEGSVELHDHGIRVLNVVAAQEYDSSPPRIIGQPRYKHGWQERAASIYARNTATVPNALVLEIEDAIICNAGQVVTRTGYLLEDLWHHSQPRNVLIPKEVPFITDVGRLLRKPGDSNFGHWIAEILPRLQSDLLGGHPGALVVPANPVSMLDFRKESLALLTNTEIVPVERSPSRVGLLTLLTQNSVHSHTHDSHGLKLLREQVLTSLYPNRPKPFRKLFVGRGERFKRQLINQHEVSLALDAEGFEVVFPENLRFTEQVRLFSEAELVIGVAGAALTNLLWLSKGAQVVELQNGVGPEFFFWDLANIIGIDYSLIYGVPAGGGPHSNFEVDLQLIWKCLEWR